MGAVTRNIARLDIVLVGVAEVTLIELTIPHNSTENIYNASDHKSHEEMYLQVLSDFEAKGLATRLMFTWWKQLLIKAAPTLTKTNNEEDYGRGSA